MLPEVEGSRRSGSDYWSQTCTNKDFTETLAQRLEGYYIISHPHEGLVIEENARMKVCIDSISITLDLKNQYLTAHQLEERLSESDLRESLLPSQT